MASVFIVSYDLVAPGKNYEALLQRIKAYGAWATLGGSAYLILADATPEQIRDNLSSVLDGNDKLWVGVAPAPSAWRGLPDEVARWIHANQK